MGAILPKVLLVGLDSLAQIDGSDHGMLPQEDLREPSCPASHLQYGAASQSIPQFLANTPPQPLL